MSYYASLLFQNEEKPGGKVIVKRETKEEDANGSINLKVEDANDVADHRVKDEQN